MRKTVAVLTFTAMLMSCGGSPPLPAGIREADVQAELQRMPARHHHRNVDALIGLPIGILAGGLVGYGVGSELPCGRCELGGLDVLGGAVLGVLLGAIVGPLVGDGIGDASDQRERRDEAIERIRAGDHALAP